MNLLIRRFSSVTLFFCLGIASSQALAINVKPGLWEWTTTMKIPGTSMGLPALDYRSCISIKDLVPRLPGNEHCKITSHIIEDERVDWIMECTIKKHTYIHTGNLTFNKTTAMGQSQSSSNGSAVNTMLLGSYIGACK